ncbi:MAG TPA: DUF1376 domain-containing protein [Acidobacteriaceae bacterium]|nr:DUF1376 domain-containing protein [Acidobacteriaceae bacterium]
MPVFIGDYLADTMHLSTEQHGAYLLLLFHLWRRGLLPDDDGMLGQITGLDKSAWSRTRPMLAEFFEIRDGLWHHGRVERERTRVAAKHQVNANNAKLGASRRWSKRAPAVNDADNATRMPNGIANGIANGNANGNAKAMRDDADSHSESESELFKRLFTGDKVPAKRSGDPRHTPFRAILAEYWSEKNHASPEMPWQGRDAKALSDFLAASPNLSETQFRQMLGNRARSAVAHGDRVYLWIGNLTRFQEEITVYNKPASAGGGYASRAEINRNSVVSAVDRALQLAREHADRTGQASVEPAAFHDAGMSLADGTGPDGCALAMPGNGDHGMAAGHAADGEAGTDGPLPYRPATAAASEADRARGEEVIAW